MCKAWPCCDGDDYNIRRYDSDGETLWDYLWKPSGTLSGPLNAIGVAAGGTLAVGSSWFQPLLYASGAGTPPPIIPSSNPDIYLGSDIVLFNSSGTIVWTKNLADEVEPDYGYQLTNNAGSLIGVYGNPVSLVLRSDGHVMVFLHFMAIGTALNGSVWLRAVEIDPADGTVVAVSSRLFVGFANGTAGVIMQRPRAWVGGGAVFAGDTCAVPISGQYGNINGSATMVAIDTAMNWQGSPAASGIIANSDGSITPPKGGTVRAMLGDENIVSTSYRLSFREDYVGLPFAAPAVYVPPGGSNVFSIPFYFADESYPSGGGNFLIALCKKVGSPLTETHPTICEVSTSWGGVPGTPLVLNSLGAPHVCFNPIVDQTGIAGEFIAEVSKTTSTQITTTPGIARFEADGTLRWYHNHATWVSSIASNGDAVCVGGAIRKNDRSFLTFP